ncbi:V-type proton ATPase subunit G-like [Euphorbia lathyris]|uniref:V-type proton ATPase subunit G-like n=1 Tax=Euphorbia lathyris TaxID=212925 RepID=UPI003313BA93
MDSMKGQGGIQMLLSAEEEAQQIVLAARNLKLSRLKQAKDEAEKESSNYRSHMESQHQKILSETSGNSGSTVKRLEEETETKTTKLKECGSKIQADVVGMIMKCVTTV